MYVTAALAPLFVYLFGWSEVMPRFSLAFICWNAVQARRSEWLTDQRNSHTHACTILFASLLLMIMMVFFDTVSFFLILSSWSVVSAQTSSSAVTLGVSSLAISILNSLLYILICLSVLHDMHVAISTLQTLYLYSPRFHNYINNKFNGGRHVAHSMIDDDIEAASSSSIEMLPPLSSSSVSSCTPSCSLNESSSLIMETEGGGGKGRGGAAEVDSPVDQERGVVNNRAGASALNARAAAAAAAEARLSAAKSVKGNGLASAVTL